MMLPQIEHYWTGRAKGYSEVNQHELATGQDRVWLGEIRKHLPKGENLKILDVGTGPGFFAILLARAGYDVTAVDYTEAMLAEAKKNAGEVAEKIHFQRMDAQKLDFEDGIFDLVISRNVLWNLEQPEQAYREWLRVLKPNGTVMNFDGNFYYYVTDAEYGDRTRWEHKHMQGINAISIDRIGEHLPMARRLRPEWDVQELQKLGAKEVCSNVTNEKILEDGHHLILNFQVSAVKAQV